MKIPEFRLPYMAILGPLGQRFAAGPRTPAKPSAMTHLSWDEFGGRVLERRSSRENGTRGRV
jgi:hypothetical protein